MAGIPDAELPDQSWMTPEARKKLPVAPYSEFNPPPQSRPADGDQTAEYVRKIYRFLIGSAIGGLIGFAIYLLIVYL